MAVTIRLQRGGAKHNPVYRMVAADSRKPRDGRFCELLGTYSPKARGQTPELRIKLERVDYWLGVGAQTSDTVRTLIKRARKDPTVVLVGVDGSETVDGKAVAKAAPKASAPEPEADAPAPKAETQAPEAALSPAAPEPEAAPKPEPEPEAAPEPAPEPEAGTEDTGAAPEAAASAEAAAPATEESGEGEGEGDKA